MKPLNKHMSKILSLGVCILTLSACGTQSSRELLEAGAGASQTGTGFTNTGGNIYNLPAAPEETVVMSGNGGPVSTKTISTTTSRTLKVKVQALSARNMSIPGYENWVFPYGCLQLDVTVNGARRSVLLKVDGVQQGQNSPCASAPSSKTLDFTNVMTGNGATTVLISNAVYDNCRTYNPFYYGCYMSNVWQNHMVAANITTQIDGTWME